MIRQRAAHLERGDGEYRGAQPGHRFIYNPGSVGQPRDGDSRAASAIYDTETGALTHHRTQYDIPEPQRACTTLGLPEPLSARLSVGR